MGRNSFFAFKQFRVDQADCAMRVTTDACIFGAWAPVYQARKILDIGTGSGLLALMAAQRSRALVDSVESDPASFRTAQANFISSPWSDRLRIFHTRVQDVFTEPAGYDLILCNPPFFEGGTQSPQQVRARSRHTDSLPHTELVDAVDRLMGADGKACILLPETVAPAFARSARSRNLHEARLLYLSSTHGRPPHRRATVFSRTPPGRLLEESLYIHSVPPDYTPETVRLLKPYYLYL